MQIRKLLLAAAVLACAALAGGQLRGAATGVRLAAVPAKPAARAHARRKALPRRVDAKKAAAVAAPNDPLWQASWGLRAVGAPGIWRWGTGAPSIVVAVVDTGVDPTQPDLAGALVPGWNTIAGNADTTDDVGHGTAVAGVIAARSGNGVGGTGLCGRCAVMPVKALDARGGGNSQTVADGIEWATAHGARVINLSLMLEHQDAAVTRAVADAVARGVVVVAAAGNNASTTPNYPAADAGAIAVAGDDAGSQLYAWSARGGWVTVAAPGCNQATQKAGGFGEFCGTSSAAAAVSGLVALGLADSGASGAAARTALVATAAATPSLPRVDGTAFIQSLLGAGARS